MKYLFTTLAIGQDYLNNSVSFFESLKNRTTDCDFSITTNVPFSHEYIKCNLYQGEFCSGPYKCNFYFNLKCLAIKAGISSAYDFVVYIDGDFRIGPKFDENKMRDLFQYMVSNEIDFEFERYYSILDCKETPNGSGNFCQEKLSNLGINSHNLYDAACTPNEQILVYKTGPKFQHYVQCYERWLWYCIHNKISHYAEGVEMGISALESNMKVEADIGFKKYMTECFEFDDGRGNTFTRY